MAHSIYECKGARTCAIELHSFSKNAGFTGVRLGYTVVPKDLKCGEVSLHDMWARRHGTKFNGAPYIVQRAGEAVYSEEGKAQLKEQVAYYMKNAKTIKEGLKDAGYTVFGGVNAPYIWLKTPDQMTSWEFFDYLLENANVVGTPGSGFGPSGEGYFRLTGRLKRILWSIGADKTPSRVYPMEIENVLSRHSAVDKCAVVGRLNGEKGYLVIAYVTLKSKDTGDNVEKELRQLCRQELKENSWPFEYHFVEKLPTTGAGKIDFRTLEKWAKNSDSF